MTLDRGRSYVSQDARILWGTYFFYSEEMLIHSREMQNFFNVLSDFGGITEILIYSVGVFVMWFNRRFERSKFVKSLYFLPSEHKSQSTDQGEK